MRRRIAHGLMIGLMIIGLRAAQGPNNSEASSAPTSPPQNKPEIRKQVGKGQPYQVGTASWYGEYFEGKPTASGEDYDMYDMTAAHPTLPLGSYVKVTNLRNGKAVVVKVNDRPPVVHLNHYGLPIAQVGHLDVTSQRKRRVGRRHVVHIIVFSAGGRFAIKELSVPGGRSYLVGLVLGRRFAGFGFGLGLASWSGTGLRDVRSLSCPESDDHKSSDHQSVG